MSFGIIVGFSFLGVKICVGVTTALLTIVWRYNAAFLGAALLLLSGVVRIDLRGRNRSRLFLTAVFYITFMILQAWGLTMATSVESGIVFAVIPVFAQIIAFFFLGERTTLLQTFFVLLSVTGVVVMYGWGAAGLGQMDPLGFFILLLSSLSLGASNVMMRYVRGEFGPLEVSSCIAVLGFAVFNLAALLLMLKEGLGAAWYLAPLLSGRAAAFVTAELYLGIPCLLLTSALTTYSFKYLTAVQGAIFGNLSVVISIFAGILLLREPFYIYHLFCTAMILAGVAGTSLAGRKSGGPENRPPGALES